MYKDELPKIDTYNIRDVGLAIFSLDGSSGSFPATLRSGRLLRGPVIEGRTFEEVGRPKTIINLRPLADLLEKTAGPWPAEVQSSLLLLHCPTVDPLKQYDTPCPAVRGWLSNVLRLFERPLAAPVLLHCRMGRDRTGVAVAALLLTLGVPEELIITEFLLSEGACEELICASLAGIRAAGGPEAYFEGVDLGLVRQNLAGDDALGVCDRAELDHILEESRRLLFLGREATRDRSSAAEAHSYLWLLDACNRGACLAPCSGAVAELMTCKGLALTRLGRPFEAHQALRQGLALASADDGEAARSLRRLLAELDEMLAEPEPLECPSALED